VTAAASRRAWVLLALTSVGQMLTTYSGSALDAAFPAMQADFGVRRTALGWALSGYSIASAALLLVAAGSPIAWVGAGCSWPVPGSSPPAPSPPAWLEPPACSSPPECARASGRR
jgi:hypothetical protein